jgi:ribosome-binding protein aMBF1 (putative translation factor)
MIYNKVECDICGVVRMCAYVVGPGGAEAIVCDSCREEANDRAEAERDEQADRKRDMMRGL